MNDQLDKIKEYVNDVAYNVKNDFSLNLDEIIESEFEKAFEILDKYIEYIKREYGIDYKKPELIILEDEILKDKPSIIGSYSPIANIIIFSKKSIEREIDKLLKKYLSYIIKGREYLNRGYNSIFMYPLYINEKNEKDIRKAIAEFIIRSTIFHEIWHSIDNSILDKLEKDPTIKDRDYLLTILKDHDNFELRASAFQVVMYYLVNGFHKHKKGYICKYVNIPMGRKYIEKLDILEKNKNTKEYVPYDLGYYYGNIIVAKYGPSLKENIYKVINDIIHLDKKRAIDEIKLYGDNLEWISNDKNSNFVI